MTPNFDLTPRQREANRLLGSVAPHVLLRGGSRSGKTFLLTRALLIRALKAPASRHAIWRLRLNHLTASIQADTLPKVRRLCFPDLTWKENKQEGVIRLPNDSEIWLGGLDDKARVEKVLGQEFSTVYFNECSQIPYASVTMALTRLAQKTDLVNKAYYDCNPPGTGHWTYRLWVEKKDPVSRSALPNPDSYVTMQINPRDNAGNLASGYIEQTLASLPAKARRRFLDGEWVPEVDGALWTYDGLEQAREPAPETDAETEALRSRMRRIVVAIDPSGCSGPEDYRSDEIGIAVVGVDAANVGHVLEDVSGRYSPEGWARAALNAYDRWRADKLIGERNFGGAMVESTIKASRRTAPVELVTASRGKYQRAEPVAALYEQGRVRHHGIFVEMEDQFCNFAQAGYQGDRSPDRADAAIWGITAAVIEGSTYNLLGAV